MRFLLQAGYRVPLGLSVALAVLAHAKGAYGATLDSQALFSPKAMIKPDEGIPANLWKSLNDPPGALKADSTPSSAPLTTDQSASQLASPSFQTLSPEAARLWLSSYNAGPYALLRYKGFVPYKETRDYAPRVFKYYQMNLSSSPYEPYIQASACKYGLDPQMVRAIIKTESDFNPRCSSGKGARGLLQVMPVVWQEIRARYGLTWDYQCDVWDPEKNIEVGCAYLAWLQYDFLPRKFAAFDPACAVPTALIRDTKPQMLASRIATGVGAGGGNAISAPSQIAVAQAAAVQPTENVAVVPGRKRRTVRRDRENGSRLASSGTKRTGITKRVSVADAK